MTLNNPTIADCVKWSELVLLGNQVEGAGALSFFICQTERSETGTLHYQGYCEFKKSVEWSGVKAIFGELIHIENSRGNAASNIKYCTKSESRVEGDALCVKGHWGRAKKGGSDLMAAIDISNGVELERIREEHPLFSLKYMEKMEAFAAICKGDRTFLPKMDVYIGKTGVGKSRFVLEKWGKKAYWVSPPASGKVWFGHYAAQAVCVFDDFHAGWFQLTHLLRIMDRYPLYVAPKGGQVPFHSERLVFTSNVDPKKWYSGYKGLQEHKDALERRIREFCTIYDCTLEWMKTGMGHRVKRMKAVKRTEEFAFQRGYADWSASSPGSQFMQGVGNGDNNPYQNYGQ